MHRERNSPQLEGLWYLGRDQKGPLGALLGARTSDAWEQIIRRQSGEALPAE
jgi:hypothetical protein